MTGPTAVVAPQKTLFLDRDGTVIVERDYLSDPAGVVLERGAARAIRRFAEAGYRIVVVSNQSGIGRGYFGEAQLAAVNARIAELLGEANTTVHAWYHCPHAPGEECTCRKPLTGMLDAADTDYPVNWRQSIMAGDKPTDVDAARARKVEPALVLTGYGHKAEAWARENGVRVVRNLSELADIVLGVGEDVAS